MPSTPQSDRTVAELAELAGGLAHELRNPLSTMMVNLKLLAEDLNQPGADADDVRRRALLKVDVLRREAERLQGLFDDFLRLMGPCRLEQTEENLNAVVTRLVEFFEPSANSTGVEVRTAFERDPLLCPLDETLLSQALLNVVINAQQAMPDGGELVISTGIEGDQAVITIRDTGVGVSKSDRERILRPFFSTKAGGNGLGLSITQRIVHEHGGSVGLRSKLGEGMTFTIKLPIRPPGADDGQQPG